MKPLLIFDYDGTLHDTMVIYEDAFRDCHQWLIAQGYAKAEKVSRERISSWLGMNVHDMWHSFLPDLPETVKTEAASRIGTRMISCLRQHQGRWYEGATEVLDQLRAAGYPMVILSNCRILYRETNWEVFSMERWFQHFYDCETYDFRPKTEIIKEIQNYFPGSYIVVGDRRADLDCAKACGSPFIGCLYGYGGLQELEQADQLAVSVREIPECVARIRNQEKG